MPLLFWLVAAVSGVLIAGAGYRPIQEPWQNYDTVDVNKNASAFTCVVLQDDSANTFSRYTGPIIRLLSDVPGEYVKVVRYAAGMLGILSVVDTASPPLIAMSDVYHLPEGVDTAWGTGNMTDLAIRSIHDSRTGRLVWLVTGGRNGITETDFAVLRSKLPVFFVDPSSASFVDCTGEVSAFHQLGDLARSRTYAAGDHMVTSEKTYPMAKGTGISPVHPVLKPGRNTAVKNAGQRNQRLAASSTASSISKSFLGRLSGSRGYNIYGKCRCPKDRVPGSQANQQEQVNAGAMLAVACVAIVNVAHAGGVDDGALGAAPAHKDDGPDDTDDLKDAMDIGDYDLLDTERAYMLGY